MFYVRQELAVTSSFCRLCHYLPAEGCPTLSPVSCDFRTGLSQAVHGSGASPPGQGCGDGIPCNAQAEPRCSEQKHLGLRKLQSCPSLERAKLSDAGRWAAGFLTAGAWAKANHCDFSHQQLNLHFWASFLLSFQYCNPSQTLGCGKYLKTSHI